MINLLRTIAFVGIGIFGVVSIVATSPSDRFAPVGLVIVTKNNPDLSDGFDHYDYYVQPGYACLEEVVRIKWIILTEGQAILSATPPENLEPALSQEVLAKEGELEVKVLGKTELMVQLSGDYYPAYTRIDLIPEALCNVFPTAPMGQFIGTLEQTAPEIISFARRLSFQFERDYDQNEVLRAFLSSEEGYARTFICDHDGSPAITCEHKDDLDGSSITLSGEMSETGFFGTYEGKIETATNRIDYGGSFSFTPAEP